MRRRRTGPAVGTGTIVMRWSLAVVLVAVALLAAACGGDDDTGLDAVPTSGSASKKVTVAGDSISFGLGGELRGVVPGDVVVKLIGEGGTGLARPDTFDWPTRLRRLASEFPPDVLVFSVGSNDAQDLTDVDGKVVATVSQSDAWDAEYSKRLGEAFDSFAGTNTKVVWVGQARSAKQRIGDTNRRVQRLAAEVASSRPWVEVADMASLLGTGELEATACLTEDGVHLKPACYEKADKALLPTLGLSP